jgi:hypothetical protein
MGGLAGSVSEKALSPGSMFPQVVMCVRDLLSLPPAFLCGCHVVSIESVAIPIFK